MDSITQAALGAAIGEAILGRRIGSKGAVLGVIVATVPDLDIIITPLFDSVERLSIHRGYSHSILLCFIGALLSTYLFRHLKWTKKLSSLRLYVFSFLALFTHILLDAFTTYGTQLYLPFSDERVSFDSINIVDPVYTLPLIIGLVLSLRTSMISEHRATPNFLGILISSLYLSFTLIHKQQINHALQSELAAQSIQYDKILTVPVGVANVNWYGVARSMDSLYIGYMKGGGEAITFDAFAVNDYLLSKVNEKVTERLRWFSQGFYTVGEKDGVMRVYNMQCDMQGVRHYGDYKAPTAFYFELSPQKDGSYELSTGMHPKE